MELLILHNIATSYYKNIVFNALENRYKEFKVIHLAETQSDRKWEIDLSYLNYPYKILFKGNLDKVPKIKLIFKLLKTLGKEDFKMIYLGGYTEIAYWVALIYSKVKKKKIILEMDSNRYNIGKRRFYKEFLKKIFVKMCDYGITYGKLSKEYFVSLGMPEEKIVIKPNVTDNEYWKNEAAKYKAKREEIIKTEGFKKHNFIYVGRFSEEKNLFFLLKAFKEAKNQTKDKNWGLILVGGGPLLGDLKDFVENEDIKDVFFLPFKQRNELPKYYAVSDILILPSLREPWGIVVNEAMASGLVPLISRRCGSKDLIKENQNGFLFDPLDKNNLVSKIKKIINAELDIKKVKNSALISALKYTPEYASEKVLKLLKEVNDESKK